MESRDTAQYTDKKPQREPVGPLAAIIIVVIMLGLGGAYFFITQKSKFNSTPAPDSPLPGQETATS
ncbi:hypothetical protein HYS79_02685 [Patescibacteria group bacterium]|nr:hypothetical protein [Patescibacteria group bacterium]